MTDTYCSREGCTKKLRANNTKGVCSSGCEAQASSSPATGGGKTKSSVMKSFRTVATALGKDPNAILEEAAKTWLDAIRRAVE